LAGGLGWNFGCLSKEFIISFMSEYIEMVRFGGPFSFPDF
jgi:hypothetical protein